jgi:hypothetical protein
MNQFKAQQEQEGPYVRVTGLNYLDVLGDIHASKRPDWYFEIGSQKGASLMRSQSHSIAVDPAFMFRKRKWTKNRDLHMFEETSDAFFENGRLDALGLKCDLAFLDGMHLYEYLLRDFFNTEKYMNADGTIILHDCLPWSENVALRDRSQVEGTAWTGDVWKVVAILAKYRPDLDIKILDAAPSGLVVVSNLDPANTVLEACYQQITEEFEPTLELSDYLSEILVQEASAYTRGLGVWPKPGTTELHFAIKTSVPKRKQQAIWGDHYFAVGLQSALLRLGHKATIRAMDGWSAQGRQDEIDIVISGRSPHPKRAGHLTLQWMISFPDAADADHYFCASDAVLARLAAERPTVGRSLLLQAFDADVMAVPEQDSPRQGVLFVGIWRDWGREIVDFAIASGCDLKIWGEGWTKIDAQDKVCGKRIANADLGQHYAAAEVVLNDHTPLMKEHGFVSNRIFDALASGAPIISDDIPGLPAAFAPFVERVSSTEEFTAALARIREEPENKKKERHAFALKMREQHSFDARAKEILNVINQKLADVATSEKR